MITATRITITMMRTTQMITMIKRVLVKDDVKVKIKSNGAVRCVSFADTAAIL